MVSIFYLESRTSSFEGVSDKGYLRVYCRDLQKGLSLLKSLPSSYKIVCREGVFVLINDKDEGTALLYNEMMFTTFLSFLGYTYVRQGVFCKRHNSDEDHLYGISLLLSGIMRSGANVDVLPNAYEFNGVEVCDYSKN